MHSVSIAYGNDADSRLPLRPPPRMIRNTFAIFDLVDESDLRPETHHGPEFKGRRALRIKAGAVNRDTGPHTETIRGLTLEQRAAIEQMKDADAGKSRRGFPQAGRLGF